MSTEVGVRPEGKWWVLVAIGVGTFMSALDSSIVNTVLPVVRDAFHSSLATVQWVVTVYLLVVSGLLLSFGRLGDMRGHRNVYLCGFGLFVLSSAGCGLASSVSALVACRAVQAVGAAMLYANAAAILTASFPPAQRGRALGLQATMTYLGLTTGPSLGGWLANQFGWRVVFFVNVPVGLLAVLLSLRFIPRIVPAETGRRFDFIGAIVFMVGLVCLLLGLNRASAWGWGSTPILGLLTSAVVLLVAFVAVELRLTSPMLDVNLFVARAFSTSVGSAVLNYVTLYSILFLMPFYLIQGRGLNPSQAGLVLTAQPLVMALVSPLSGAVSDRIGSRIPTTLGMLVLALGTYMLSRLGVQATTSSVALALAITGLGTGLFAAPNNSTLMGSAPRNRQGVASGVLATARNVGMVLGVGTAGALLTSFLGGDQVQSTSAALVRSIGSTLLVFSAVAVLAAAVAASNRRPRDVLA